MLPRIGTSGWSYRWWWGRFYPREVKPGGWLAYYARQFDTVELNASFYWLPSAERFVRWRDAVPEGFLFAVKAPRIITHIKKLKECGEPLQAFLSAACALGEKLGPLLFQLPPSFHADAARLEKFLQILPRPLPNDAVPVFEFRHESWFTEDIHQLLQAHDAAFCVHDHQGMQVPGWITGSLAYRRFHGSGGHATCYGREGLRDAAAWLTKHAATGAAAFAFFNNDANACAVRDALSLKSLVRELTAAS